MGVACLLTAQQAFAICLTSFDSTALQKIAQLCSRFSSSSLSVLS